MRRNFILHAQVIAGICLAVWLINIPRFNDPLHGGWVRSHTLPAQQPHRMQVRVATCYHLSCSMKDVC